MKVGEEGDSCRRKLGRDLRQELAYRNHRSVHKYKGDMLRKAISDVALGRAMVLKAKKVERMDGLRISPVEVVEKKKVRVIHDLSFERRELLAGSQRSQLTSIRTANRW